MEVQDEIIMEVHEEVLRIHWIFNPLSTCKFLGYLFFLDLNKNLPHF